MGIEVLAEFNDKRSNLLVAITVVVLAVLMGLRYVKDSDIVHNMAHGY